MLNKSLKEEYTKYFKELKNIIACIFYSILCFAPTILFFIYLFILGDNNPPLNDSLLAILLQILYLPLPGWIYINRHYSYTIKEYIIESFKFYFKVPFIILFVLYLMLFPLITILLPILLIGSILWYLSIKSLLISVIIIIIAIIINILWVPIGNRLVDKIFKILPF